MLGNGLGDTLGSTGWDELADAKGGGHGGEDRESEDTDGRHCDENRDILSFEVVGRS